MKDRFEELIAVSTSARELWERALVARPVDVPKLGQIADFDRFDWGRPLLTAVTKNLAPAQLDPLAALYFGVYETGGRYGLSGKILYLSGLDTEDPEFDARNLVWKPRWGRFRPRVLQKIALLEEGIPPDAKLKPPVKVMTMLGDSTFTVYDFAAANPDLDFVDLSADQVQCLNYYVTLAATLTIVADFLDSSAIDRPVFAGFDEGDRLAMR